MLINPKTAVINIVLKLLILSLCSYCKICRQAILAFLGGVETPEDPPLNNLVLVVLLDWCVVIATAPVGSVVITGRAVSVVANERPYIGVPVNNDASSCSPVSAFAK